MALTVDTGQVAANTGSATTTITVTAQGKAIILFSTGQTANGSDAAANASWSFGFSDGTTLRSISWAADDNVATTNCGRGFIAGEALTIYSNGTPTKLRTVTGVAFTNATTTTLTWDGTPAAAYLVGYMQFGGSDITNVAITAPVTGTTTGDKTVTGVGFQPDFGVFFMSPLLSSGTSTQANGGIGFAVSNSKQFTMCWGIDDGQTMGANIDAVSYTDSSNFLSTITLGAETIDFLASFGTAGNPAGWNSDGFDYNVSNAQASSTSFACLLIKGGQWDVGTTTTPTSSGTRSVTGMSFQPTALFQAHCSATANATVTLDCNSTVGAATSTSTEVTASGSQDDAVINTTTNKTCANSKILQSGSFPTTSVDFTSFNSDGWTVTDASAGATAYQVGWFACASNAVAPSPGKKLFAALLAHRRFGLVP